MSKKKPIASSKWECVTLYESGTMFMKMICGPCGVSRFGNIEKSKIDAKNGRVPMRCPSCSKVTIYYPKEVSIAREQQEATGTKETPSGEEAVKHKRPNTPRNVPASRKKSRKQRTVGSKSVSAPIGGSPVDGGADEVLDESSFDDRLDDVPDRDSF